MRITRNGIQRKCDSCGHHFPTSELWPTAAGEICPSCKSTHMHAARAAGIAPVNQHRGR